MTGERKIVGIRLPADDTGPNTAPIAQDAAEPTPSAQSAVLAAEPAADTLQWVDDDDIGTAAPGESGLLRWALHGGVLLWLGLILWTATGGFRLLPPQSAWPAIAAQIVPALLLWGVAATLWSRFSTRAHAGQIAVLRSLQAEYAALDERLQAMHGHLRDADRDLQARATTLSGFGLDTAARLHDAGQGIATTMARCTEAANALADRSAAGQRQLDSLALAIPRLEEITARLSENLRTAGQSAYQFGGQLEAQIANLGIEAATTGAALSEASSTLAGEVTTLRDSSAEAQAKLVEGAAMLSSAAAEQRDQSLALLADYATSASEATQQAAAQIAATYATARASQDADAAALRTMLEQVQGATQELKSALQDAAGSSANLHAELAQQVQSAREQLASVEADGRERMATLSSALGLLSEGMAGFREHAQAGDEQAVALIQRAETLLIALDSATREIDETVPAALTRLSDHAHTAETVLARLTPLAEAEREQVAAIEARLDGVSATLAAQQERIAALAAAGTAALAARQAELTAMEKGLADVGQRMAAMTDGPLAAFASRLAAVEGDAGATLARTEEAIDRLVRAASEQAAADIGAAIDRVAGAGVNERLAAMSAHADQAVAAAAAASDRLMRQLITIADSSAALEQRAQEVSALSANVERETLARQMALLGEALQSTAVDLTRILDHDVADQAWDAYLKGDRSIFARRAAKLLSYTEARDLRSRYESDESFKAQVNRYIHDFETMLRGVMDTRDGNALSVTLLSSDIGKLYVALAQAIERLRR